MAFLLYIFCFVTNFVLIQCGEYNITVSLDGINADCSRDGTSDYNVPRGEIINIFYHNRIELHHNESNNSLVTLNYVHYTNISGEENWNDPEKIPIKQSKNEYGEIALNFKPTLNETNLSFRFYYLRSSNRTRIASHPYLNNFYARSACDITLCITDPDETTTVTPDEATTTSSGTTASGMVETTIPNDSSTNRNSTEPAANNLALYIGCGVGATAALIIGVQTVGILYFKAQAAKLGTETNLSVNKSGANGGNDSTRYSTMPGQKGIKIPSGGRKKKEKDKEQERESKIYETVNINMTDLQPPKPPAISTLPRLPRNHPPAGTHLTPPASATTLRGKTPQASPMMKIRELPRPIPATPVSQRPPIPLPTDEEHYEDVEFEKDDTYEPPPILETQQPRAPVVKNVKNPIPVPPKPVDRRPAASALAVKPKPVPKTKLPNPVNEPVTSELDKILKKRRNVIQVPIQPIPEPSTSKNNAPVTKPKPPPVVRKPVMQPPVEEPEVVDCESYDSSDEEWTYEPLKPIDHTIYNV